MDDKRARQIHLLWRDLGSCMAPMAYNELAGMMSKALEQLQMFKSKVSMSAVAVEASSPAAVSDAACECRVARLGVRAARALLEPRLCCA